MYNVNFEDTEEEILAKTQKILRPKKEKKIVLCGSCAGIGYRAHEELVDYHKRDYVTFREVCEKCNGSGKLLVKTVTMYLTDNVVYTETTPIENSLTKEKLKEIFKR